MFETLVDWVEDGVAPGHIVASDQTGDRTAKICMYPNEVVHSGVGSQDDEASYACIVHTREPSDLAASVAFAPRLGDPGDPLDPPCPSCRIVSRIAVAGDASPPSYQRNVCRLRRRLPVD